MSRFRFTLYVAGETARSQQAYANLRRLCEERLGGDCRITVVDVVRDPEAAETGRVLTTPTVVREEPAPPRRVTGDLSDPDRVLAALALHPDWPDPHPGPRT
jgi:circadian clock protein KaiB